MAATKRKKKKSPAKRRTTASRRKSPAKRKSTAQRFFNELTPERRIDVFGVILLLLGALTLLSLVSSQPGGLGDAWLRFVSRMVGWGLYLMTAGLLGVGLWMLLRNNQRVPPLNLTRILGGIFLFTNLLIWLHIVLSPSSPAEALELAAQGIGGGEVGAALLNTLQVGLGLAGTVVLLMAWLLIGLALTLDRSVASLFAVFKPVGTRIQKSWRDIRIDLPSSASQAEEQDLDGAEIADSVATEQVPGVESSNMSGDSMPDMASVESQEPSVWALPNMAEMLDAGDAVSHDEQQEKQRAELIEETLASFGAPASVVEINRGPTITQFGVEPDFVQTRNGRTRVRVSKIAALADDMALALAASRIRIQAPVPGKGFIGIEVPNEEQRLVAMRDVMESPAYQRMQAPLRFALGQDVAGKAVSADLAAMPHLLIAGATGSGKSVAVNALICGLLLNNSPADLRVMMVDPKRVELTGYNGIPHLLTPVITEIDRVVGYLQWVTHEMDKRYEKFSKNSVRNIQDYNKLQVKNGDEKLPYMMLIIDELADLMMVAPDQTEKLITRMAQLARATGIHLVISTQRPSVDVVTGLIKANFPARISFAVASGTDSRVILDQPGAERLLGSGDMLFQPPDAPAPLRLQGVFLAESEIIRIVNYWRAQAGVTAKANLPGERASDMPGDGVPLKQIPIWEQVEEIQDQEDQDEIFMDAVEFVRRRQKASISMLQRQFRIGYTRSARIVEMMESRGIVGPPQGGAHHREILDYGTQVGD
jgi:S-DNA-T family DNA segregation ATPase FtsK/SpoIIIE